MKHIDVKKKLYKPYMRYKEIAIIKTIEKAVNEERFNKINKQESGIEINLSIGHPKEKTPYK